MQLRYLGWCKWAQTHWYHLHEQKTWPQIHWINEPAKCCLRFSKHWRWHFAPMFVHTMIFLVAWNPTVPWGNLLPPPSRLSQPSHMHTERSRRERVLIINHRIQAVWRSHPSRSLSLLKVKRFTAPKELIIIAGLISSKSFGFVLYSSQRGSSEVKLLKENGSNYTVE